MGLIYGFDYMGFDIFGFIKFIISHYKDAYQHPINQPVKWNSGLGSMNVWPVMEDVGFRTVGTPAKVKSVIK